MEFSAKTPEIRDLPPPMKPPVKNNSNPEQNPSKNFNIIDIFLNNSRKPEKIPEKQENRNYNDLEEIDKSPNYYKEKSKFNDPVKEKYQLFNEKSQTFNEKSNNFNEKSRNFNEKSHNFNEKSHNLNDFSRNLIKHTENQNHYPSKSPNQLDFQPILPENIETDHYYLQSKHSESKHSESSKLKDPQKDFSIFGQFIASSGTNIRKIPTNKSISPFSREEKSIQKTRSSRFFEKNEEIYENNLDFSRKSEKKKHSFHNNTLHNASASVLSNFDFGLKSFISNRPQFVNVNSDNQVIINVLNIFKEFI